MNVPLKFPAEEIRKEVETICRSAELSSKLQLCRLLRYLVDETLAGREENLKGFTIGLEVFKREKNFNPEQDPIVRIHAGRLRRMLKLYFHESGKNDPVRIYIPKGNYIPVFSYKTEDKDQNISETRFKDFPIEPKLAVMLFKNATGEPDKDYFARGFSEELSVELTRYEDLIVYNCLPSPGFLDSGDEINDFIQKKKIRFVLDGSVHYNAERIKVLARLTDVKDGEQLWAERYIRDMTANNLSEIQESIINEIATFLGAEYGVILQKLTKDSFSQKPLKLDTYASVLRFYYFQVHQTSESARQAFHALEETISKDPESGIATILLAVMHGNHYMLDHPNTDDSYNLMKELSERAFKLEPNSLIVNTGLAYKYFVYNERERFFEQSEKCLAMNPGGSLRMGSLAFHLSLYGDWERGKAIMDEIEQTSISYPLYFHGANFLYYYRKKDYNQALLEANKYSVPALFWSPLLRTAVLGQLDRVNEARPQIDQLMQLKPDFKEKALFLISRFVKENDLAQHLIEGLNKAGIKCG